MRLANVPLLVIVLVFCWLTAGELLGHRRWLQTLATAAVVLQPQLIHMTATINPDVALAAIWCPALWLMVRILRAGRPASAWSGSWRSPRCRASRTRAASPCCSPP